MMDCIFNYEKSLTNDEFKVIYNIKKFTFDRIKFERRKSEDFITEILSGQNEMKHWIDEFNNRAFDLSNVYVMLMNYYNQGIPDDEWNISPGKNGESVQYFPNFKEKHYAYNYWFGFYIDSFYTKFFGLIDNIYHIFNSKYYLKVPEKYGFNKNVIEELKKKDINLANYLDNIRNNNVFREVSNFRNDIVHNYRRNQIDDRVTVENRSDGSTRYIYGVGKYTTTKQFVENIEKGIEFLAKIADDIRDKI